jgi:hypothetical protein
MSGTCLSQLQYEEIERRHVGYSKRSIHRSNMYQEYQFCDTVYVTLRDLERDNFRLAHELDDYWLYRALSV